MTRIFLWLAAAVIVYLLLRSARTARPADGATTARTAPSAAPRVVQCAYCGIHAPQADIVTAPDGRVFCSKAHLQAALDAH